MGTHNICLYKEVNKEYTGCNLNTVELLDCALTGLCAVIRSNTVYSHGWIQLDKKKKCKKKKTSTKPMLFSTKILEILLNFVAKLFSVGCLLNMAICYCQ